MPWSLNASCCFNEVLILGHVLWDRGMLAGSCFETAGTPFECLVAVYVLALMSDQQKVPDI